ncbi:MAG: tail fiber domain-containing protein, partial [Wenzhouxiangella sp.]|nr:tail fiber domain-containing protein [Wenzhouxiangella sp.]
MLPGKKLLICSSPSFDGVVSKPANSDSLALFPWRLSPYHGYCVPLIKRLVVLSPKGHWQLLSEDMMKVFTALILFVFMAGTALAASLTYQGEIQDGGEPLSGSHFMQFELFTSQSGGSPIDESFGMVNFNNGLFQAELDFDRSSFDGGALWLEITIEDSNGNMQVLSPRQRVGASPVALFALEGNEGPPGPQGPEGPQGPPGSGGDGDSFWTEAGAGSGISYQGGRVAIGTSAGSATLDVRAQGERPFMVSLNNNQTIMTNSNNSVTIGSVATGPANGLRVTGGTHLQGEVRADSPIVIESSASNPFTVTADSGTSAETRMYVNNHGLTVGAGALGAPQRGLRVHSDAAIGGHVGINLQPWVQRRFALSARASSGHIAALLQSSSGNEVWGIGTGADSGFLNFYHFTDVSNNATLRARIHKDTGAYLTSSDKRLKTDIEPVENVLEGVLALEPASYQFIEASPGGNRSLGFMAQDVQQVFPDLVVADVDDGYLGLNYAQFSVLAIQAVREQQAIID